MGDKLRGEHGHLQLAHYPNVTPEASLTDVLALEGFGTHIIIACCLYEKLCITLGSYLNVK